MRYTVTILLCFSLAACATTRPKISAPPRPPGDAVIFPKLSMKITPAAAAVINRIASEANAQPDKIVEVVAPPIRPSRDYDPGLAAPRAIVVEHALIAAGVPEKRIERRIVAAMETADPSGSQEFDLQLVFNQKSSVSAAQKHAVAKREHYIH